MKQDLKNLSDSEIRRNPKLFQREDLTPEEITILFRVSPQWIMKNEKIQIPKSLILDFLSKTISLEDVIKIMKRPETEPFYAEAIEIFVLTYKFNFNQQTNGKCPGYVVDTQLAAALEKLASSGIKMDFDLARKAFHQIGFNEQNSHYGCYTLRLLSKQLGEEAPDDLQQQLQ